MRDSEEEEKRQERVKFRAGRKGERENEEEDGRDKETGGGRQTDQRTTDC